MILGTSATVVLSWVFGVTTVIGAAVTVYFGLDSRRLRRLAKSLDWDDVRLGATDLAGQLKETFEPDVIYAPALRGGILALFIANALGRTPDLMAGMTEWTAGDANRTTTPSRAGFDRVLTSKWSVFIPQSLYAFRDQRILVVDDLAFSGDALVAIKEKLIENGFDSNKVKSATLVATNVAIDTNKAPDFYWRETDSTEFFFPWGRAR